MEAVAEVCGGQFARREFGGAESHDMAQEKTEGALQVAAETARREMLGEGQTRRGGEPPGEAVAQAGRVRFVVILKEGLDAFEEFRVGRLKEEAGGFGGGAVREGLRDEELEAPAVPGAAVAERLEEVGVAREALCFGTEAEDFAEGFREEAIGGARFRNDPFIEAGEAEVGRVIPEQLEPTEEVVGAIGARGVGFAFAEGLLEGEAVEGGGEFREMLGGLDSRREARFEVFVEPGAFVGSGERLQVVAQGLGEIGCLEKSAAGCVDCFEGAGERGFVGELKEGFEVGDEVFLKDRIDRDEEGFGGGSGVEPTMVEGVLQEGAEVLQTGLFAEIAPELREVTAAAEVEGAAFGIVSGESFLLEGAFCIGREAGICESEAMGFRGGGDAFGEPCSAFAGIAAGKEFRAPVLELKGALRPEIREGTAPAIETIGGPVMPDFDRHGFRLREGEEGERLRVGDCEEEDLFDSFRGAVVFGGGAAGEDGVFQFAGVQGFEVLAFEAGELPPTIAFQSRLGGFFGGGCEGETGFPEFAAELQEALRHGEEPGGGGGGFLREDCGVVRKFHGIQAREPGGEERALAHRRGGEACREKGIGGLDRREF